MVQVWSKDKRGASTGKGFNDPQKLEQYLKNLRRPAKIMNNGEKVGEVWKENGRWNWWFDSDKI